MTANINGLKIEYTIDNFSELISVDDYVELAPKSKVKGVYFLYSIDKELLYIGKSISCLRGRICRHLITLTPHPYNDHLNEWTLEKRKDYFYFAYTIVNKEFLDMVERFLIQKYKPKYNIEFNY
jgi:excinuclease UvrABC nuclease subunit